MPNKNYHEVQLQNQNKFDVWNYGTGGHLYNEKIKVPADVSIVMGHPMGQPPKRLIPQALKFPIDSYKVEDVKKWLKENKIKYKDIIHAQKGEVLKYKNHVLFEVFYSLRGELEQAVVVKFGKDSYVSDFSDKEVIIGYNREAPEGPSYQTDKYTKIGYKFKKGEITFVGDPKEVERKTTYEGIEIDAYVWATLTLNEKFIRDLTLKEE